MARNSTRGFVYPDEFFKQTTDMKHERCVDCNGVPIKPHQHDQCGHIFCEGCATAGIRLRGGEETPVFEYPLHTNFMDRIEGKRMMTVRKECVFCKGCDDMGVTTLLREFFEDRARTKDMGKVVIECPYCREWSGKLCEFVEGHRLCCKR